MAKRELTAAQLAVAQSVVTALGDTSGAVVVAVSGGADSLALAAGTAWAARQLAITPTCVVVNHQLQEGSAEIAEVAAQQCRDLGLAAAVEKVTVAAAGGPEAAARDARYAALLSYQGPVLLGHTLDDQAETVLLGLARGSGTRSLAGIAPRRGRLLRPMLGLRRTTVAQACQDWGLAPWSDPHNNDPRYARVRVREKALPLLETLLGPGMAEALARTAELARQDADFLDSCVADYELTEEICVAEIAKLPDAIRTRLVRRWLISHGANPTAAHVAAVDRLIMAWRGQGTVDVGVSVRRSNGKLIVE
ncbi:MAG: tRNA lysidine(34) synthetase TilS [Propionibacteriaceae bacterium]